jgi:hypothetical protein
MLQEPWRRSQPVSTRITAASLGKPFHSKLEAIAGPCGQSLVKARKSRQP